MLSKTQQVWRHLVVSGIEHGRRRWPSLGALGKELSMGISTVYRALDHPIEIGSIRLRPGGGIRVVDPGRLLMLWAGHRRLNRDLIERFEVKASAPIVEASITGAESILGGFGAAVAHIGGNRIADYDTVLVYGTPHLAAAETVDDADPQRVTEVLVAEPDSLLPRHGRVTPLSQAWVDLFALPGWQAARFVRHLLPRLVIDDAEPTVLSA
jgi:hypothetical protein